MTRISRFASSILVTSLMIAPLAAFAQPTVAPAQASVPAGSAAKTPPGTASQATPAQTTTPAVTGKDRTDMKPQHAKMGSPTHVAPTKTAEPNKS